MRYPIIINENGYIFLIKSEKSLMQMLEPIDIKNGEYIAYDSNGMPLRLFIKVKIVNFLYKIEEIHAMENDVKPHTDELRNMLINYLSCLKISLPKEKEIPLNELITIISKNTDAL